MQHQLTRTGDAVTLTKLAIDLYQNVFLVAKAAPESFNTLCNELVVVKVSPGRNSGNTGLTDLCKPRMYSDASMLVTSLKVVMNMMKLLEVLSIFAKKHC